MRRRTALLACVAIVQAAALIVLIAMRRPEPSFMEIRAREVLERAENRRGGALLIGDSITRAQTINELCGLPVFNAGISGSQVRDWTELGPRLVEKIRPKLVVYALGVNDAANDPDFQIEKWSATYAHVRRVPAPQVLIFGILNGEGPFEHINPRVAQMNARLANGPGFIRPFDTHGLTFDGLHLNSEGQRRWAASVTSACA